MVGRRKCFRVVERRRRDVDLHGSIAVADRTKKRLFHVAAKFN
jgi:hypothetical protein